MGLSQIKSLETREVRAVAGGGGTLTLSFVSLMYLSHWTCSVSSGLADILKNECSKLPCKMHQEIKRCGLLFFQLGTVLLMCLRILSTCLMPSALTE